MKTLRAAALMGALTMMQGWNALAQDGPGAGAKPVSNPWVQEAELTGSDSPYNLGSAVSIGANTIAAAATGVVYVYVKAGASWASMTEVAKLTASDGSPLYSVAVSGKTILAGAYSANGFAGEAFVFVEPPGGWANMTETAKLTPSDAVAGDYFGFSVAIDGNTAVVGAFQNDAVGISYPVGNGAAYVFVKPLAGWSSATETGKLTASDGVLGDDFGYTVAVSGNTIAAGAPDATIATIGEKFATSAGIAPPDGTLEGAVYVFAKPTTGWVSATQTAKLTASNGTTGTLLGYSLGINGITIAAGAIDQIYIYTQPSSGWVTGTETAELADPSGYTFILQAVAICNPYILAGYPQTTNHPLVDLFSRPSTGWASGGPSYRFRTPADNGIKRFGTSVSVNGTALVMGSPLNGPPGGGSIYVYGP